ncbi:MAG: DUF1838 domain-containing protein [Alphaproteobacteria bacterium]|nr:DUF1838 domain-containing protein [Alphaproteobacteria bacterium]
MRPPSCEGPMTDLDRRAALAIPTVAAFSAPAFGARRRLDFTDRRDLIYAQVKMDGDLEDRKEVISWMKGIVYAIFDDGRTMPAMFGAGMLAFSRSYRVDETTYKNMSNFTIVYTDLATGQVLDAWRNPWLDRTVKVVNYASTLHTTLKPLEPVNDHTALRVEWQVEGNDVIRWTDGQMKKKNPISPAKWPKASVGEYYYKNQSSQTIARLDELENSDLTSVAAVQLGQRHGPWYPWQEMGQAPGRTYRRDTSRKAKTLDEVPRAIVEYAARHYPDHMSAPKEWTGVYMDPETLWAETMPPENG